MILIIKIILFEIVAASATQPDDVVEEDNERRRFPGRGWFKRGAKGATAPPCSVRFFRFCGEKCFG